MASIKHEVWIDAPIGDVLGLLDSGAGISRWWDQQTERDTAEGKVLEHTPGPEHGTVQFLVLANGPNEVIWRCISSHPSDTPASAWTGTEIAFRLGPRELSRVATNAWAAEIPVQTVVLFEHSGWNPASNYFAFCNAAWAEVLVMLRDKAQAGD